MSICGLLSNRRNDFEFDSDWCWQCADFNRRASRIWFARPREIFRINAVIDWKVFFHVREKDGDIDDVLPSRASVFEHEPHILEYGMALRFDLITHDIAGRIERHAGNFFASAHTRSDPRQKQKFAYALGVRKCTHRFRRSFAFEGFVHRLFTARLDGFRQRTFSISTKTQFSDPMVLAEPLQRHLGPAGGSLLRAAGLP